MELPGFNPMRFCSELESVMFWIGIRTPRPNSVALFCEQCSPVLQEHLLVLFVIERLFKYTKSQHFRMKKAYILSTGVIFRPDSEFRVDNGCTHLKI